ncbi:hypothetical protein [Spirosoma areae]
MLTIHAQNLVPNPSFELLKKKPCQIITLAFVDNINNYIVDWTSPTNGTADIHTNEAQPDTTCQIGLNRTGYAARSGSVCGGISTGTPGATKITGKTYREYLQCKLMQKLTPGKTYYVALGEEFILCGVVGSPATRRTS